MNGIIFYLIAVMVVFSAAAVITRANPLMSAVWLIVCLIFVAVIFALLQAPFLAVLQVLISAGAVMVLFIFVIMLVDLEAGRLRARWINFAKVLGFAAAAYLAAVFAIAIMRPPFQEAPLSGDFYESPLSLSNLLLSRYVVSFELAGILLLAATVGAIVIAKKRPEVGGNKPDMGDNR